MNLNYMFVNFVAYDYIDQANNTVLENYCKEISVGNQSISTTYLSTHHPEVAKLVDIIRIKTNELKTRVGIKQDCIIDVDRIWCNINNNTNIDLPHSHPMALFSAVYYVKAKPNCGDLVFITPNSAHQNGEIGRGIIVEQFNEFTSATWSVSPEEGKLVIFPSWLTHYVQQNKSNDERISIALDFFME